MTGPIDSSGLTGMLGEVVSALNQSPPGKPPVSTGEGADGRIRVRAVMPGRIEGLELDPEVMRLPAEELAREIESAVNGALANLQGRTAGAADLGGLTEQLKEIQLSAERRFALLTASLAEAQDQLVRRAEGR